MRARVTIAGHPVHQILIPIPLGLFIAAVLFDAIGFFVAAPQLGVAAFWDIVVGIAGGLVAAVFGIADWTGIPKGTRARKMGVAHALSNVTVLGLFTVAAVIRFDEPMYVATGAVLIVELIAFAIAGAAGWMGGQLVDHYAIGVHEGAHPNLKPDEARRVRNLVLGTDAR